MRLIERELKLLGLPGGRYPFEEWLDGLDEKAAAIIAARLTRVRTGNFGDFDATDEGVIELRVHYGPGYRVYFGQAHPAVVVLLWGGDKSTQHRDTRYAQELWRKYKDAPEGSQRDFGAQAP